MKDFMLVAMTVTSGTSLVSVLIMFLGIHNPETKTILWFTFSILALIAILSYGITRLNNRL